MEQPQTYLLIGMASILDMDPESSELVGIPEPETFVQLPWDKRIARVWCTCFRNREEENPGHLTSDCRGNLKIFQDQFQEKIWHEHASWY